jgi:hypothetical protein
MFVVRRAQSLALVGLLLIAGSQAARGQVFNSPSGNEQFPPAEYSRAMDPKPVEEPSHWPKLPMPHITMPKVAWPDMSGVFAPVKSGYGKVTAGSKKMWDGTKEIFNLGNDDAPVRQATYVEERKPSLWQKLTTRRPQPTGPQTVGEFMSQPRIDP